MKRQSLFLAPFFIAVFLLSSCIQEPYNSKSNSQTESYHRYGDRLINNLVSFDNSRVNCKESLASTTMLMDSITIHFNSNNARDYTYNFELVWGELNKRIFTLNRRYNEIQQSSNNYFMKLNEVASELQDEKLQAIQLQKNEKLREDWFENMSKAKSKLNELNELIKEGGDFYKILLLESMRSSVRAEISELRLITIEASQIINELKYYSDQGLALIQD